MDKKHFYWIDWFRFIAALMVVVCHVRSHHWMDYANMDPGSHSLVIKAFFAVTRAGLEWVVVFFVLSGFLVGGGCLSKVLNQRFNLSIFVIDRFTRIWVPLIPAFALSYLVGLECGFPMTIGSFLGNIFALQGVSSDVFAHNAPLWSLSYEIWFYVLIGSIAVILTRKWGYQIVALTLFFLVLSIFTKLNPVFMGCWLIGVFCFFLISQKPRLFFILTGAVIAIIGMIFSQFQADSILFTKAGLLKLLPTRDLSSLIESLGIGLLICSLCTIAPKSPRQIAFEKLGTKLAAWSYTLYLTHFPLLMLMESHTSERYHAMSFLSFSLFILKICICLISAWLLYLPFEAKTGKLREWVRNLFASRFSTR